MSRPHIVWYNTTGDWKHMNGTAIDASQIILTHPNYDRVGVSEEEALRRALAGLPDGVSYELVQHEDYPDYSKQDFVDAWECSSGAITCNLAKARGIHMDRIRVVRNDELAKEDVNTLKAIEAGDTSAQDVVKTKKQTLRDIPQTFDLTTDTEEELQATWPAELPARE